MVLGRLAHVVVVLLLVSVASMLLLELVPGDPAYAILGNSATPDAVAALHHRMGLDRPAWQRYLEWFGGVLHGDFGNSLRTGQPVLEAIGQKLPVTVELAVFALLIALVLSLPAGVYTGWRVGRPVDRLTSGLTSVIIASPVFLTALFLDYFLAVKTGAFPATGWRALDGGLAENLRYAFLPALTLAVTEIAVFTRLLRSDMITVLGEEYIANASAKGLPTRHLLLRHALKPASFSLFTLSGLSFGRLLGGAVIVELIFGVPGIGQLMIQSIQSKDYIMIQGLVLLIAFIYVVINAVIDIVYVYLDPRVRTEGVAI
ncbi:ABC transporter permease subunit [Actinomadura sp. LD22]|uniref:ABC transporter permease subunit n=1 Tax=Actinomadura physcomitrii TaxID=2650748 RepID=A0A6I4MLG8_9ACTN|nr:ABC transporter permease [Actinomadura physcomitrii]MWA04817.1 ABC transporter permease subunit [Actinomadura physcomitrii]